MEFIVYVIIGVLVGFTGSIMSDIEEHITAFRRDMADRLI